MTRVEGGDVRSCAGCGVEFANRSPGLPGRRRKNCERCDPRIDSRPGRSAKVLVALAQDRCSSVSGVPLALAPPPQTKHFLAPPFRACKTCGLAFLVIGRSYDVAHCLHCSEARAWVDGRIEPRLAVSGEGMTSGQVTQARIKADPERYAVELERSRTKNALRHRAASRFTDIDAAWAAQFRARAKRCAMCGCRLGAERHMDHIVPLRPSEAINGTHTRDNVQITCPSCNLAKNNRMDMLPATQLNLFMAAPAASAVIVAKNQPERVSRKCGSCGDVTVPASRAYHRNMHCYECKPKGTPGNQHSISRERKPALPRHYEMIGTAAMLRKFGLGYKRIGHTMNISRDQARTLASRAERLVGAAA